MGKKQPPIDSFEHWIECVFDHPVTSPPWYSYDSVGWDGPSRIKVAYLTRLFEDAEKALRAYSERQISDSLWYIADHSGFMASVMDQAVPLRDRGRCTSSMYYLFERFFAKRCSQHLSHTTEPIGSNLLKTVCYMWWDILGLVGNPERAEEAEVDRACLEVMRKTLDLQCIACQESALHGLGEWYYSYPTESQKIIKDWLEKSQLSGALLSYAHCALEGRT